MGGAESKQITETQIKNEIEVTIKNETENLNKIFNQTINSASSSMTSTVATAIEQATRAKVDMETGDLVADGPGSSIDLTQDVKVQSENKAIISIVSNSKQLADLGAQIQSGLENATKNDSAAKASMDTLNTLKKSDKDAGGVEGMVASAMKAVSALGDSLTGAKNSTEAKTMISNKMKQDISNKTVNSNDITNIIKNETNSMVTKISKNKCSFDTSASARMKIGNVVATGGGKIKAGQTVSVTAFNDCLIKSMDTTAMVTKMTGVQANTVKNETSNKSAVAAEVKAKTAIVQEKVQGAALTTGAFSTLQEGIQAGASIVGGFTNMIMILGGIALLVVGVILFTHGDKIIDTAAEKLGGGNINNMDNMDCSQLAVIFLILALVFNIIYHCKK